MSKPDAQPEVRICEGGWEVIFPSSWSWFTCCEWLCARDVYKRWDGDNGLFYAGVWGNGGHWECRNIRKEAA